MLLAGLPVAGLPARAAPVNVVEIFSNTFTPRQIQVARGETVTWLARDGGHTVTAQDGRFDMPPEGTLARGDTAEWTFTQDETFSYVCKVHAPAMSGVIVVGAGDPPPVTAPPEERIVPSDAYPTLPSALEGAPPRSIVSLRPGVYGGPVVVPVPGLTVRGTGETPAAVRIDVRAPDGVVVGADGVRLENLTIGGAAAAGVRIEGAARGSVLRDVAVESARAGVLVRDCDPCDVLITGLRARGNLTGLNVVDATGVVVHGSTFAGNGVGIALKTLGGGGQAGAHVWSSTFTDNDGSAFAPDARALDLPVGAGIWIAGGSANTIEGNTFDGGRYGVVIAGGASVGNRVIGNRFARAAIADVGWDGLGAATCFGGNAASTSEPPAIEVLYPCARPTVGIPYPKVTADLLRCCPLAPSWGRRSHVRSPRVPRRTGSHDLNDRSPPRSRAHALGHSGSR